MAVIEKYLRQSALPHIWCPGCGHGILLAAILRAIEGKAEETLEPEAMTPLSRIEWEHIQQALAETSGNISATARLLGMHRRSLQRKLAKRPPGNCP